MSTLIASRTIHVRGQFVALHCWPEAPEEVAFLRFLHRHTFNVRLDIPVSHNNRDLEFFIVQQKLRATLNRLEVQLGKTPRMSCEDMALFIQTELVAHHEIKCSAICVDEDGENGATLTFNY